MLKEVKSEARAERESEVARLKGVADKEIKNAKEAAAAKVHTMQKRADEKLAFAQKKPRCRTTLRCWQVKRSPRPSWKSLQRCGSQERNSFTKR